MAADPDEFLKRVAREASWLRELVARTASGLDRLALDAPHSAHRLRHAAMWLRRQLHEGPPEARQAGLGVGRGPSRPDPEKQGSPVDREPLRRDP